MVAANGINFFPPPLCHWKENIECRPGCMSGKNFALLLLAIQLPSLTFPHHLMSLRCPFHHPCNHQSVLWSSSREMHIIMSGNGVSRIKHYKLIWGMKYSIYLFYFNNSSTIPVTWNCPQIKCGDHRGLPSSCRSGQ